MTTVSDDFNRANSSDLGANWSEDTGGWAINSNTLIKDDEGSPDRYKLRWVGTALSSSNYYVEADIHLDDQGSAEGPAPAGRMANGTGDSNTDCYCYEFIDGNNSYINRLDDSARTILATGGSVSTFTTYPNCRLEMNGSNLTGTRNGAADVSTTDATYASGGVGITWAEFGIPGTVFWMDNWEAGDLAAAAHAHGKIGQEPLASKLVGLVR